MTQPQSAVHQMMSLSLMSKMYWGEGKGGGGRLQFVSLPGRGQRRRSLGAFQGGKEQHAQGRLGVDLHGGVCPHHVAAGRVDDALRFSCGSARVELQGNMEGRGLGAESVVL